MTYNQFFSYLFICTLLTSSGYAKKISSPTIVQQGYVQAAPEQWPNLLIKDNRLYYLTSNGGVVPLYLGKDGRVYFGRPGYVHLRVQAETQAFYQSLKPKKSAMSSSLNTQPTFRIKKDEEPLPLWKKKNLFDTRLMHYLPYNAKLVIDEDIRIPPNVDSIQVSSYWSKKCYLRLQSSSPEERVMKAGLTLNFTTMKKYYNEGAYHYVSNIPAIESIYCENGAALENVSYGIHGHWVLPEPNEIPKVEDGLSNSYSERNSPLRNH